MVPHCFIAMLKFFLADAARHRARVNQLDFIGAFLQAKVEERIFVKLHERYAEYFPEYQQYFGRTLRLLRSMYGMTISGKLFVDDLTEWLTQEADIKQSNCQMSFYYKFKMENA